jgi:hypothetical protein
MRKKMATRKNGTGYRRRAEPVGIIPLSYGLSFSGLLFFSPNQDAKISSNATRVARVLQSVTPRVLRTTDQK